MSFPDLKWWSLFPFDFQPRYEIPKQSYLTENRFHILFINFEESEGRSRRISADEMVSAISLCILAIGLSAASSQLLAGEGDPSETQVSDRRTFKHGKPVKLLPLVKKHKKFAGFVPHVFGKTSYAEVPLIREPIKPLYKVHRYQGIEVKPVADFSVSTPDPFIDTHSAEPPSDPEPTFTSDYPFPHSSNLMLYPEKPLFPAPAFSSAHVFPPPKPIFQFVPVPSQPIYPSFPITSVPSIIPIARPAAPPAPVLSQPPVFTSIPASFPPQPVFSPISIKEPILPPLPSPSPAPVFSSVPIKIPAPALPPVTATPSPLPVFSAVSITPPPLGHAFPSSPAPSPLPISSLPPPTPSLSSISLPEPSFPYPPSGVPIPSYIKDISLGDIEIKDTPLPTIETPVTSTIADEDHHLKHVIKAEDGFLQKFKGWKADKASAALSHFAHFMQKPFAQYSIPLPHSPTKIPPPQPSVYPNLHLPVSSHPLPLAPAPVFFPSSPQFIPKYENFPPNNIESPPLLNSYGVPISHDTFASAHASHASHDRLSSAASEEEPSVVPAPSGQKEQSSGQGAEPQQRPSAQVLQEFQTQNLQSQPQSTSYIQPIYVPESEKTAKEEDKAVEDGQPEAYEYSGAKKSNSENALSDANSYHNHKE